MIFEHTWQKVLSREKTQTRRLHRPGDGLNDPLFPPFKTVVSSGGRTRWMEGCTYAVQPGRGKPAVARIEITDIRREDVRSITQRDAKSEGFDSKFEFMRTWISMHDKPVLRYPDWHTTSLSARPAALYDAWVLTFRLCE